MIRAVCVVMLSAGLVACAPPIRKIDLTEVDIEAISKPLECSGAAECAKMWRAAQAWVAANSGYKIQAASDAIVQTYNARDNSRTWAFTLLRVPREGEVERIELTPSCGRYPSCDESSAKMVAQFRRAMRPR